MQLLWYFSRSIKRLAKFLFVINNNFQKKCLETYKVTDMLVILAGKFSSYTECKSTCMHHGIQINVAAYDNSSIDSST